jgi:hypothetical protein
MFKRLFWVVLGAVAALQADRWLREQKGRFTPNALTGTLLDKVNRRLETQRATADAPADRPL